MAKKMKKPKGLGKAKRGGLTKSGSKKPAGLPKKVQGNYGGMPKGGSSCY
jgi:hypothetical protein